MGVRVGETELLHRYEPSLELTRCQRRLRRFPERAQVFLLSGLGDMATLVNPRPARG